MNLVPVLEATHAALINAGVSAEIVGEFHPGVWVGGPRGPWFTTVSGKKVHLLDPQQSELELADIAHGLAAIPRFGGHVDSIYEIPREPTRLYTVAQHSILVTWLAYMDFTQAFPGAEYYVDEAGDAPYALRLDLRRLLVAAVSHDASEAFLGDIIRPLKRLLPFYKVVEDNLTQQIVARLESDGARRFAISHGPLEGPRQQMITLPDAKWSQQIADCMPFADVMKWVKRADRLALHIERELYTPNPPKDVDADEQVEELPPYVQSFLVEADSNLAMGGGAWSFDRAKERYMEFVGDVSDQLADTIGNIRRRDSELYARGYDNLDSLMSEVRTMLIR